MNKNHTLQFAAILSDVRSVHNVGSIFRTADAAGFQKIYCCGITPTPLDRFGTIRDDFAKVSLGAETYLAWEAATSTTAVMRALKKSGWKIFAIEQDKHAAPYYEIFSKSVSRAGKHISGACPGIALVVGNEVSGLSRPVLKQADKILEIPMFGKKESLNVAVAFGIVAFGLRIPASLEMILKS